MSKFSFSKLSILLIIIVFFAIIFTNLLCFDNRVSYAESINVVYPTDSYYQIQSPTKIVANDEYIVIYDNENKTINVFDTLFNKIKTIEIDFSDFNLFIVDNIILLDNFTDYFQLNISTENEFSLLDIISINNISSDGHLIYYRTPAGAIYLYDSSYNLLFNDTCDYFTGKDIIMDGYNSIYYFFSYNFSKGKNQYIKFSSITDDTANINNDSYININSQFNNIKVIDDVFICENDNSLTFINITSGNKLFDINIEYDYIHIYNDTIYTIKNNSLNIYKIDLVNQDLILIDSLSNTGSSINYLNYPTDIIVNNDSMMIADQNNNRIVTINDNIASQQVFSFKPIKIAKNNDTLYILNNENKIIKIENELETIYSLVDNIIDIKYFDKLYVLSDSGLYTLIGNDLVKIFNVSNAKAIEFSNFGKILYLLTNQSIVALNQDGNLIPYSLDGEFSDIIDFAVDGYGNFILADKSKLYNYENKINSLELKQTINIDSTNYNLTLNSIYLYGKTIYITCDESIVIKIDIDSVLFDELENNDFEFNHETEFKFIKFNDLYTPNYLPTNFCLNNIEIFNNNPFILITSEEPINGYSFAIIDNKKVLVDESKLVDYIIENDYGDGDGFYLLGNTKLYYAPSEITSNVTLDTKTIVTPTKIINNINGSNWIKISIDNNEYYIKASDLYHLEESPDEDFQFAKAKTKAKRIGSSVKLYSSTEFNEVIAKIGDGKEITILNEFQDFYYVQYGNQFGYIYKEDVQLNGLTHLQILAIILACVVVIISSTIYIMIYFTKHKRNE